MAPLTPADRPEHLDSIHLPGGTHRATFRSGELSVHRSCSAGLVNAA